MVEVECRTSRRASRGRKHPIIIHPDWSVETPHDLAAERVAAAFGGYTSCLDLVDRAVPVLRMSLGRLTRTAAAGVAPCRGQGWLVTGAVRGCRCVDEVFPSAARAAGHARSADHLAMEFGAAPRQVGTLLKAAAAVWGSFDRVPPTGWFAAALVRESGGLDELWSSGVHPDDVATMAALVPGCVEPLPVWFYLGVAFCAPDRRWLSDTLAHCPDPDVAAWLAWTAEARRPRSGDAVRRWLELGVPRNAIEVLLTARVPPDAAVALVGVHGRSARRAALDLVAWAQGDCRPTAEHMMLLDRLGIGSSYRPSGAAIDLLCAVAADLPGPPSRTELGVMLALAGGRSVATAMLRAGARTPADVMRNLTEQMEAG